MASLKTKKFETLFSYSIIFLSLFFCFFFPYEKVNQFEKKRSILQEENKSSSPTCLRVRRSCFTCSYTHVCMYVRTCSWLNQFFFFFPFVLSFYTRLQPSSNKNLAPFVRSFFFLFFLFFFFFLEKKYTHKVRRAYNRYSLRFR